MHESLHWKESTFAALLREPRAPVSVHYHIHFLGNFFVLTAASLKFMEVEVNPRWNNQLVALCSTIIGYNSVPQVRSSRARALLDVSFFIYCRNIVFTVSNTHFYAIAMKIQLFHLVQLLSWPLLHIVIKSLKFFLWINVAEPTRYQNHMWRPRCWIRLLPLSHTLQEISRFCIRVVTLHFPCDYWLEMALNILWKKMWINR